MAANTSGSTRADNTRGNKASANSHPALILPGNTSEFNALCNALRAHHSAMHGDVSNIAAYYNKILPKIIGGRRGLFGADAMYAARQVTKPLRAIAKLNQEIARLYVVSYTRYTDRVVNIQPASAAYDVDK